jgi:hypothetical protein
VFVSLLLDANVNIRCKAAGALQSLAVHPANQQVHTPPSSRLFQIFTPSPEHQVQRRCAAAGEHDVQVVLCVFFVCVVCSAVTQEQ